MRMFLSAFLIAACIAPPAAAFAPPRPATATLLSHKPLSAISPEHVDALSTAVDSWQHAMATSSHLLLADAVEATAETAKQDGGWWASYLSIFESSIRLVHSIITPPLNSLGVTETWGISIAVFTACTLFSCCVYND